MRFAFLDVPTGWGMIELLEPDRDVPTPPSGRNRDADDVLAVDSATIVTGDLDGAMAFFEPAFGWVATPPQEDTLEIDGEEAGSLRRVAHRTGTLRVEFVEPHSGDNLYSRHLADRDHGLVHVGARARARDLGQTATCRGRWLRTGEAFRFVAGPFGAPGLRLDERP